MCESENFEDGSTKEKDFQPINRRSSCWGQRSRTERHLTLALTTTLFVSILLVFVIATLLQPKALQQDNEEKSVLPQAQPLLRPKTPSSAHPPSRPLIPGGRPLPRPNPEPEDPGVCLTKGCVKTAAAVIERMDDSTNPCEDFFKFSCGGFLEDTIIPDDKSSVTTISVTQDKLQEKLRLLVEKDLENSDSPATAKVKKFYASCLDKESIEELGLEPLMKVLDALGGWPVVEGDAWNEDTFSWVESIYKSKELGFSTDTLIEMEVITDLKNTTWRMLWFDQPMLELSREYFQRGLNDSDVRAFLKYLIDVAKFLGADSTTAEKDMKDVLEFEMKISNISLAREQRRNISQLYNPMTLNELQNLSGIVPWVEYVNSIIPPSLSVDETERVGVSVPKYFEQLSDLLEETPNRVLANYLISRVVSSSASFLTEELRDIQFEFTKKVKGQKTRLPRWEECMKWTSNSLEFAIASMYVKNYFNEEAKEQADELITYIRNEFEGILETVDWMDDVTRAEALSKAKSITPHIGYPQQLIQDQVITDYYADLEIGENFYENSRRVRAFSKDVSYGKLREKVDKLDWERHGDVARVNAFYNALENSIKFPAGILQGSFFGPDRPKYMNFGAIGLVIGHEITHGFDDQGKQFDAEGNLRNWWAESTEKKFLEKAKCIIHQYGNFTAPENGMKLNGINTQGENIADNGGIKEARNAYQKWVDDNGPEQKLPGLPYTPNQMFWISSGQTWCSLYRPEYLKHNILSGVHSPGRFRIVGPISNSVEFAKDFDCPSGSTMNPRDKCIVW